MADTEIFILGVTEQGGRFRPSDWAERLACMGAEFGTDARLRYAADLQPTHHEGYRAVRVGAGLERRAPQLWQAVFAFATSHGLRVSFPGGESGGGHDAGDTLPVAA